MSSSTPIYVLWMGTHEEENIEHYEEAEAVGEMLAEAFIARTGRFSAATRRALLIACRARLLQDKEISRVLFEVD